MISASMGQPVLTQIYGPRPVVFVANAYDEPTSDPSLDSTADRYGGRDLVSLRRGDRALFPAPQLQFQRNHVEYLVRHGFSDFNPNHIVGIDGVDSNNGSPISCRLAVCPDSEIASLRDRLGDARVLLPYIHNDNIKKAADRLGLVVDGDGPISDHMNNKWITGEDLRARGVLVCPRSHLTDVTQSLTAYRDLVAQGTSFRGASGVIFAKLSRGAAGRGVTPLQSEKDFEQWISDPKVKAHIEASGLRGGAFLELGVLGLSANLMMYVGRSAGEDILVGGSIQLLAKNSPSDSQPTAHVGNIGPLPNTNLELVSSSLVAIADYARLKGAFGFSGLDLVITPEGEVYYIEDNYRLNGSTASAIIAAQRGAPTWVYSKFSVPVKMTIQEVEQRLIREKLQADAYTNRGVLVINSALPQFGDNIMQVVILAGDPREAETTLQRLKQLYD